MRQFIVIGKTYTLTLDYENYYWELHPTGALVVRRRDSSDMVQAFAHGEWQRTYNMTVGS